MTQISTWLVSACGVGFRPSGFERISETRWIPYSSSINGEYVLPPGPSMKLSLAVSTAPDTSMALDRLASLNVNRAREMCLDHRTIRVDL